jgi:hypothetical protein
MPTPITSIANRVLPLLIAQAEDSTFAANNVLRAFGAAPNAIKVIKGGGESIIQPVSLGYHSVATEILTGADAYADLDTTVGLIEKKATADYAEFFQPIRISESELNAMSSEGAVDFLQDRVTNVVEDMSDRISLSVLQGAAAPAARRFSSLESLNGIGSTTGWFQGVARASQTNTVLGLSQAAYRDFGWFSQFDSAGGTLTEADVRNVMTGVRAQSGMNPDVCICSEEFFNKLAGLVDTKIQYLSLEKLGFGTLQQEIPVYNGCALFVDARMGFDADAGGVGTDIIDAYFLSSKYLRVNVATFQGGGIAAARKKLGVNNGPALISVSEFVRDPRAPVYVATVSAKLQLTTSRLNAHGVLTNS